MLESGNCLEIKATLKGKHYYSWSEHADTLLGAELAIIRIYNLELDYLSSSEGGIVPPNTEILLTFKLGNKELNKLNLLLEAGTEVDDLRNALEGTMIEFIHEGIAKVSQ